MKKISIFSLFLLLVVGFAQAQLLQSYEIRQTMDFYNSNKIIDGAWKNILTEDQIMGSPYLSKEFSVGTIYTMQRMQYDSILLRYNIYQDELQFKNPAGEIMSIGTPEIVEKAVFDKNELVYLPYNSVGKTKKGFFLLVEQGKAWFLIKPQVGFQEATEPAAYKDAEPAKFISKADDFYIRTGNEVAVLINSKKDLIAAFPDNNDKIESFISKNKIKTNKKEGLAEVVRYYNSIE